MGHTVGIVPASNSVQMVESWGLSWLFFVNHRLSGSLPVLTNFHNKNLQTNRYWQVLFMNTAEILVTTSSWWFSVILMNSKVLFHLVLSELLPDLRVRIRCEVPVHVCLFVRLVTNFQNVQTNFHFKNRQTNQYWQVLFMNTVEIPVTNWCFPIILMNSKVYFHLAQV